MWRAQESIQSLEKVWVASVDLLARSKEARRLDDELRVRTMRAIYTSYVRLAEHEAATLRRRQGPGVLEEVRANGRTAGPARPPSPEATPLPE